GTSTGVDTLTDYATAKYDKDGNGLWVGRYDNQRYWDQASGSALDPSDTVYVTGARCVLGTDDYASARYAMVKDQRTSARPSGPQDVAITKAAGTVTLNNLIRSYTGSPLSPTATTMPSGLTIDWTNAPQITPGSYAVTATVTDPNYQGAASGAFIIQKATATV